MYAGRVDDGLGGKLAPVARRNDPAIAFATKTRHRGVEHERRAVSSRVLSRTKGKLVRTAYSACRRPQRARRLGRDVWLAAAQLLAGEYLDGNAVHGGPVAKVEERLFFFSAEREDKRAVAPEGNLQFAAYILEHPVSEDVELRLVRAGLRVETGVDDRGVRLGRALGHVAARFEDKRVEIVAGEGSRGHAADDAGTNDYCICFHVHLPYIAALNALALLTGPWFPSILRRSPFFS